VREIVVDENDLTIVSTIIAMAHSLNLGVIAEGVETDEQKQLLINNNCLQFQGYLFGKPMPIDAFEALLSLS
jgi:EAL domain-containing protein (putative c-di-GMP-specific phosphodiesterase class I)